MDSMAKYERDRNSAFVNWCLLTVSHSLIALVFFAFGSVSTNATGHCFNCKVEHLKTAVVQLCLK
jgi:hypothetical protein